MKSLTILLYFTLLFLGYGCNKKTTFTKIKVENPKINLGKIGTTDSVELQYKIVNVGSIDLKIDSVISTCDCIISKWDKNYINPNDTAKIFVVLKPKTTDSGIITKTIMFSANTKETFNALNVVYVANNE
ncbi:DUF1573 domain-containing protein [Pedobacter sp.]|uniref:DUF1573 domain-containing protein n=1 Tax=Pedobacter sp. TaxID=1411316 RepID=UPI003BAB4589